DPLLPPQRAIEKVAGVELESRLRRVNLHHAAARRLVHPRRQRQGGALATGAARAARAAFVACVQNAAVIVPPPVAKLLVGLLDARSDGCRRAEVEGRPPAAL